jgi:hypothetical protein
MKIGIVTFHNSNNFGAAMQAFEDIAKSKPCA